MQALILLSLTPIVLSSCPEEAPYDVIKAYEEWEVRKFPATKWISTEAIDVMPHDGPEYIKAFDRLLLYIEGLNEAESRIPKNAPLTMRILPGEGPNCESNFTMSFFIPSDLQVSPPLPIDELVYIEERPEFIVIAKQFGGFPSELTWSAEAAILYSLAAEEGMVVKDLPLWTAGYSGASVFINRRNEVWLEVEQLPM